MRAFNFLHDCLNVVTTQEWFDKREKCYRLFWNTANTKLAVRQGSNVLVYPFRTHLYYFLHIWGTVPKIKSSGILSRLSIGQMSTSCFSALLQLVIFVLFIYAISDKCSTPKNKLCLICICLKRVWYATQWQCLLSACITKASDKAFVRDLRGIATPDNFHVKC